MLPIPNVACEYFIYGRSGRTITHGGMVALVDTNSRLVGSQFLAFAAAHIAIGNQYGLRRFDVLLQIASPRPYFRRRCCPHDLKRRLAEILALAEQHGNVKDFTNALARGTTKDRQIARWFAEMLR